MALLITLNLNGTKSTMDSGLIVGGATKWFDYATGFPRATPPILLTTIATGNVWTYNYGANTYYRLVPNGVLEDSFYSTFTGEVLSGLLATKNQNL